MVMEVVGVGWGGGAGKVKSLSVPSREIRCLGAFKRGPILTDSLMDKRWRS